jgi:TolB protein
MTFLGVTFTPDGNFIWYTAWDAATRSTLYQMPVLGGRSTKVLTQIDSPITFSPDGKQFAFVRGDKSLMIAQSDGSAQHELASCDKDEFWRYPAWSPDGSIIACSIGSSRGADDHVVAVGTRNGRKQTIPSQEWSSIFWMAWLADGSGLVLTALDQVSQLPQLWILSYPKGHSRRITNDLNSYYGVSLTGDSSSLVCVQGQRLSNIWVVPYGDSAHGIRVTSGTARDLGVAGITWTPDGQIVFTSKLAGHFNIWIMSKDGSDQRQLTANARDNYYPSVSPDGKSVAFISDRSGKNDLWKMDIDGSSPLQLTKSGGSGYPQWSMDGQWIVYEALEGSAATLRKISKDGGSSVLVIEMNARMPAISPDGKLVAFYQDLFGPTPARIATVPLAGGPSAVLLKGLPFAKLLQFHWSPDGRFLAFVDDKGGFSDIWIVPITGGSARKMTDFRTALIFTFDWSRDGKRLACACGSETSDVILISSLK